MGQLADNRILRKGAGLRLSILAAVLSEIHCIEYAQRGTLLARIKHLRRLGFPRTDGTNRKWTVFDFEETLKVIMVFQLLEAGLTTVRSCEIVQLRWDGIARAIVIGWKAVARENVDSVFLTLELHGLASLGQGNANELSGAENMEISYSLPEVRPTLNDDGSPSRLGTARAVIDVPQILRRVRWALQICAGLVETEFDREIRQIGVRLYQGRHEEDWQLPQYKD